MPPANLASKQVIYIFQGGGALGAYQVGLFQALSEHHYEPDCIGGSSIGAINASIIAGNKPKLRLSKLQEFWDIVATKNIWPTAFLHNQASLREFNYISANQTLLTGQPGFFWPRLMNPMFVVNSLPDEISFYSTEPLRTTLENLIDFDLINNGKIHLSLQAVEISCGKPVFFDNSNQKIDVRHVMASGALPPGFPAIEIDGKYYWDGGVISHMPFKTFTIGHKEKDILCFTSNLFDSFGLIPRTLDDVLKRQKDITYSSRYGSHIHHFFEINKLRYAIRQMHKKLPASLKKDPEIKEIFKLGCFNTTQFVRFLYSGEASELSSKDYEFSKFSIDKRMAIGYRDGLLAIEKSPWLAPVPPSKGVAIYDISSTPEACE